MDVESIEDTRNMSSVSNEIFVLLDRRMISFFFFFFFFFNEDCTTVFVSLENDAPRRQRVNKTKDDRTSADIGHVRELECKNK